MGPAGTRSFQPRTKLTVYAAATDYRPQTGRSEPRTITIITLAEELQERSGRHRGKGASSPNWPACCNLQRTTCMAASAGWSFASMKPGGLERKTEIDRLQSAEFQPAARSCSV